MCEYVKFNIKLKICTIQPEDERIGKFGIIAKSVSTNVYAFGALNNILNEFRLAFYRYNLIDAHYSITFIASIL